MARRGALPSSGPCRAPRAGETPHAPLVDGRMQSDECARGAGARSWPGSRASAKAPALLTQRERFLKISDGIHGALTPRSPPPGSGLSGEANRRDRPRGSRRARGTGAYHHAGLGQNASGTGLASSNGPSTVTGCCRGPPKQRDSQIIGHHPRHREVASGAVSSTGGGPGFPLRLFPVFLEGCTSRSTRVSKW